MLDLDNTNVSYSLPQTPQITNVVQRFWQVERHGAGSIRETIIPKGTVELIFNLQNSTIPGKIGTRNCVIPQCFKANAFNQSIITSLDVESAEKLKTKRKITHAEEKSRK